MGTISRLVMTVEDVNKPQSCRDCRGVNTTSVQYCSRSCFNKIQLKFSFHDST